MNGTAAERRQQLTELVEYPRENLSTEVKNWLDMTDNAVGAHVARELLALSNHGGGFLIFGFDEVPDGYQPATPQPVDLESFSQDALNAVVARYAEPRFEVEVEFVARSDGRSVHPVVIVPSDLDTPVRASRDGPEGQHITQNTYYVRRPGPESAPIQTGREWDALLDRCIRTKRELLIDRIRDLLQGPEALSRESAERQHDDALDEFVSVALARFEELIRDELPGGAPGRYEHGTWQFAYRVLGNIRELTLSDLRSTLEQVVGHETGWPVWWLPNTGDNAPHPWDNKIECWMASGTFADASHSDYWLADPRAMLFLLRGYEDDSGEQGAPAEPGQFMDLTIPTWRVGECLLHAERFAAAVAHDPEAAEIDVLVRWDGLRDRQLTTWASQMRMMMPHPNRGQDSVQSRLTFAARGVSERLPELVRALTRPLYESFDFFEPPAAMYSEELDAMRGRRQH